MHPYLIRVGELTIPSYPALYGLGITAAGIVALALARREGVDRRKLAHLILLVAFAILVGGRAFYVFQHLADFDGDWREAVDLSQGGQVLYGGMVFAGVVLMVYVRTTRIPLMPLLDVISVGAPLGLALGRLGCFCRGCCYGKVAGVPWAVTFPRQMRNDGTIVGSPVFLRHVEEGFIARSAAESLPVHPSQLYAVAASLAVFLIMVLLWRSRLLSRQLVFAYTGLYFLVRFLLEMTRDNEVAFWGLTIPQVVSIVLLLVTAALFAAFQRRIAAARLCSGPGVP